MNISVFVVAHATHGLRNRASSQELFYLVGCFVREPARLRVLAHARLRSRVQARASTRAVVQNTNPNKKTGRPVFYMRPTVRVGQRPGGGAERGGGVGRLSMSVFVLLYLFLMVWAILQSYLSLIQQRHRNAGLNAGINLAILRAATLQRHSQ